MAWSQILNRSIMRFYVRKLQSYNQYLILDLFCTIDLMYWHSGATKIPWNGHVRGGHVRGGQFVKTTKFPGNSRFLRSVSVWSLRICLSNKVYVFYEVVSLRPVIFFEEGGHTDALLSEKCSQNAQKCRFGPRDDLPNACLRSSMLRYLGDPL